MLQSSCSRNFHTYRQVLKAKKGHRLNKTEKALMKESLSGRSRFLCRDACSRPTCRPEDCHKSSACRHFFHRRRATIRRRLNLPAAIVLRRTRMRLIWRRQVPSLFRRASGMHPNTYILDVNGNPVTEAIRSGGRQLESSADTRGLHNLARSSSSNRRRSPPAYEGRPVAHHRKHTRREAQGSDQNHVAGQSASRTCRVNS